MDRKVHNGAIVPLEVLVLDIDSSGVTGLADVTVRVRDQATGNYYDWNDKTFKASGWTEQDKAMLEVDGTNSPGAYAVSPPSSGVADFEAGSNTTYIAEAVSPTPDDTKYRGEIIAGVGAEAYMEVGLAVLFDETTNILKADVWLLSDGQTVTDPTQVTFQVFDGAAPSPFINITDSSPDARGVFHLTKSNPGMVANTMYAAKASITHASTVTDYNTTIGIPAEE